MDISPNADLPSTPPEPSTGSRRQATFLALRERNARLFFGGLLVSNIGTWIQFTANTLLIKQLAPPDVAGRALGLAMLFQFLPMLLLGAWAGAFADRHNRRRLTLWTQGAMTVQAIAITALSFADAVTIPRAYFLSFVLGVGSAIDNPARRGLVTELVDPAHISNAMSLNTATMTGSRIVGPAIGAALVSTIGTSWCFLLNTVSFVAVLAALTMMRPDELRSTPRAPRGGKPVREGLRFVWNHPILRPSFLLMTIVSMFALNFSVSLPLLADERFGDTGLFGWMLGFISIGTFSGSLFLASRPTLGLSQYVKAVSVLGFAELGVAFAPNIWTAFAVAVFVGLGNAVLLVGVNTLSQQYSPPTMRSRLLALVAVAFLGSTPIGGPITGWVGDRFGPSWSLGYGGVITLLSVAVTLLVIRRRNASVPVEVGAASTTSS